ncbi:hypothetical protein LCGC14_3158470 [marine sediment metagenome]|uniref:Uncharacterized protein n=1 Tax=marine sediment metagenome TaxID=412755 RepID=A0A0F8YGG3_9ZZZZ
MKEQGQVRGRTASNIEDQSAIADLERQLAVAQRLLNFVPDQLKLLVDPEKLAYVEWNLSSTYTLQLMCKVYREGKMEVREVKRPLEEAQGERDALMKAGVTDYSKLTGANRVDCHFCNGVWRTEDSAKHKSTCQLDRILSKEGE